MKTKRSLLALPIVSLLILLTGCNFGDVRIDNLTPAALSENPSNIYNLVARVTPNTAGVIPESIRPHVVIDGEIHPMTPSYLHPDIFEFEYRLPADRIDAKYYFLVKYNIETRSGFIKQREEFTDIQQFKLTNRYPFTLEVTRAPVGARVGVVGRGFKQGDTIMVGGNPAVTNFHSSNSINFYVPSLDPGRSYPVTLIDGDSALTVGSLRVDSAHINVAPSSLSLRRGHRSVLVFSIQSPAPAGGLFVPVTTDIPSSVIMPEVVIPSGQRSVSIQVEGGESGRGHLFVELEGFDRLRVPVEVR